MRRHLVLFLIAGGIASATPLSIQAQVYLPPPPPVVHMPALIWNNFMLNQIRTTAVGSSLFLESMIEDMQGLTSGLADSERADAALNQGKGIGQGPATLDRSAGFPSALAFTPSGYSLLAKQLADADATQDAAQLDRLFSNMYRSYLTSFREEHERLGMPLHDLAATFTSYVIISYMYAHELPSLEAEKSLAVYWQSAERFLANPDLKHMTEQDKELLAETFVVLGNTPAQIFRETGDKSRLKQEGLENLKRIFGPEAAALQITDAGIVR